MENILKTLIDYSLFEKYDKEFFIVNKIVPICEDSISIKIAICNNSNIINTNNKFKKIITFVQVDELDILFLLDNLDIKIYLYEIALKSISNNLEDKYCKDFISSIISLSVKSRASDIHIESYENLTLFKFRIDGRIKIFFVFNKEFFLVISSYIKVISNLDMTMTRLPQDGRFSSIIDNKTYNFRISSMPTIDGESIVLRILDNININRNLESLGLSKNLFNTLKKNLQLNQGLVLIAGPTGSGKTTTLYSILKELNCDEKKIITIEDPVEYKIDSISQIQINQKIGLTFEVVLKNILRQDPDIILIGEIRDKFSLDIALQASLTGHLVLASIHSNSAVETITRLIDLQADKFLISSSLKLIISQRLILNYCKHCNAQGCQKCNYSKYYDRSCIAEILEINEEISSLIFKQAHIGEIKDYLKSINYKTLLDDGKEKVKNNITSIEELYKVVPF